VAQRLCLLRNLAQKSLVEQELGQWSKERNASTDRQFTTAGARTKLKRLCPSSAQESLGP
jgi:hypothetical protein